MIVGDPLRLKKNLQLTILFALSLLVQLFLRSTQHGELFLGMHAATKPHSLKTGNALFT